ncbi:MAG: hypothetical protein R6V45_02940 [Oceanipulchritudo sp.]
MNLYLIMGTHLPEIGTCIHSLLEADESGAENRVLWPEGLEPVPPSLAGIRVESLRTGFFSDSLPVAQTGNVFLLLDPRQPLLDQMEDLARCLHDAACEPAKVITCVDAATAESSPKLRSWLDACIFFSDLVLIGNRTEASKRFLRDFEKRYRQKCYPCVFMFLKGPGRPASPSTVLAPDARRISQLFDRPEDLQEAPPDLIIEASCDLDADEDPAPLYPAEAPGDENALDSIPDVSDCIVKAP